MIVLAIFIALFFAYALVSRRLEQTPVTAPMVFTAAGMLILSPLAGLINPIVNATIFLRITEIGLVLLLFTDASHTDLKVLRNIGNLPLRLLSVGMLLTLLFGAAVARLVFPHLSIWEAGILASILAPTDASLGQVIVNSPRVPIRIRQALNAEAGLNDGLSVPFLLFFMALAAAKIEGGAASFLQFIAEQLGLGAIVGAGIGLIGGWLLSFANRRRWITESFQQIAIVALPLLCLFLSEMVGASMFIAAFVAGLAVQTRLKEAEKRSVELGQLFNLAVFFLFGMIVVRNRLQFRATDWVYAFLSLTVVRMLPVAIALVGTRLSSASVVFMGWFGPRGLASIVLGLVYLEQELHLPGEPTIRLAVIATVVLSIFLHGLSAMPGTGLYSRRIGALSASAPEHQEVES
jgi:NhaP-type Na+/H+ or K+/H+ antiporter